MKKVLILIVSFVWVSASNLSWAGPLVFGPKKFVRQTGKPQKEVVTFTITNPSGTYWLQLENGEGVPVPGGRPGAVKSENLVSSAVIWVNGKEVAGPNDFNQNILGFQKDITLNSNSTLEVEVRGAPGSFLTIKIREAEPNMGVSNQKADLSGLNEGHAIGLVWSDDERANEYIIFRAFSIDGPWQELFRTPKDRPKFMDFTPEARLRDLCYRIEAVDIKGNVIRRYEPICVPKFVEEKRQSLNLHRSPAKSEGVKTGKTRGELPARLASSILLALASNPPINELCLTNEELTDFNSRTLEKIREFLEQHGSFLQGRIIDVDGIEIDVAQEIYFNMAQNPLIRINPQVVLTILQREQKAIRMGARLDDRKLRRIMGWDAGDLVIPLKDKSIREQIFDGALQLRRDFDRLSRGEHTGPPGTEGWQVNKEKKTTDGVLVTPSTKASAAMYAYNPEVGELWGGGEGVGGNSRFCDWWERFKFKRQPVAISPPNPTLTCPNGSVTFTATGGRPPYTWSTTKGVITPSGANNATATLTPPANPGSGVAGVAYHLAGCSFQFGGDCFNQGGASCFEAQYGCNDQLVAGCGGFTAICLLGCAPQTCDTCKAALAGSNYSLDDVLVTVDGRDFFSGKPITTGCVPRTNPGLNVCTDFLQRGIGRVIDKRTQNCKPCRLEMQGEVKVTV